MKTVLAFAAVSEAATGLALLAFPPIVVRLLLGAEIVGIGDVVSRFGGIGLIGLGVACWPSGSSRQALHGMLTYGTLAALYLAYIGISQGAGPVCCCGRRSWSTQSSSLFCSLARDRGKNEQRG